MKHYETYCMARYHKVDKGDTVVMCKECRETWGRLHRTYHQIIRARPHLQGKSIEEVFELLWQRFQELKVLADGDRRARARGRPMAPTILRKTNSA